MAILPQNSEMNHEVRSLTILTYLAHLSWMDIATGRTRDVVPVEKWQGQGSGCENRNRPIEEWRDCHYRRFRLQTGGGEMKAIDL